MRSLRCHCCGRVTIFEPLVGYECFWASRFSVSKSTLFTAHVLQFMPVCKRYPGFPICYCQVYEYRLAGDSVYLFFGSMACIMARKRGTKIVKMATGYLQTLLMFHLSGRLNQSPFAHKIPRHVVRNNSASWTVSSMFLRQQGLDRDTS